MVTQDGTLVHRHLGMKIGVVELEADGYHRRPD
jgi:hypothetical protein